MLEIKKSKYGIMVIIGDCNAKLGQKQADGTLAGKYWNWAHK